MVRKCYQRKDQDETASTDSVRNASKISDYGRYSILNDPIDPIEDPSSKLRKAVELPQSKTN